MELQVPIKVINFEDHPVAVHRQYRAIVLAPRVVVFTEIVEPSHCGQHIARSVRTERFDAAGDQHATANAFAADLVVQFADARALRRRAVHHSISGSECRSSLDRESVFAPSRSIRWTSPASSSGSMSRWSSSRSAAYSIGCGNPASRQTSQNDVNGRRSTWTVTGRVVSVSTPIKLTIEPKSTTRSIRMPIGFMKPPNWLAPAT